jgi:hypothetical protein
VQVGSLGKLPFPGSSANARHVCIENSFNIATVDSASTRLRTVSRVRNGPCAHFDDSANLVLDRDLDKTREPSSHRIRCPLCGWSPRK